MRMVKISMKNNNETQEHHVLKHNETTLSVCKCVLECSLK